MERQRLVHAATASRPSRARELKRDDDRRAGERLESRPSRARELKRFRGGVQARLAGRALRGRVN